jgi:hypothetical protein
LIINGIMVFSVQDRRQGGMVGNYGKLGSKYIRSF